MRTRNWPEQELLGDLIDVGHDRSDLLTDESGSAWVCIHERADIFGTS